MPSLALLSPLGGTFNASSKMRISRTACTALAPVASSSLGPVAQVALLEQARAGDRFRRWAAKRCPDARLMNVGSDLQIRQLLFGGKPNCKDKDQSLPPSRVFKVSSPPWEHSHRRAAHVKRRVSNSTLCIPLPVLDLRS
jgi:hypothetical protein